MIKGDIIQRLIRNHSKYLNSLVYFYYIILSIGTFFIKLTKLKQTIKLVNYIIHELILETRGCGCFLFILISTPISSNEDYIGK